MARAVAARLQGDDYQIRFFWLQACRLLEDKTKVVSVEIESDEAKSLDDVVVRYSGYSDAGESIHADFYQVKFHVKSNGAFTWQNMMDPSFVNANSVSILQRLLNAQRKCASKGCNCRFNIFSPWQVHPDNEMGAFHSLTDGSLRWDVLSRGGPKSRMGKVREAWKRHLGLRSDEELQRLLRLVRVHQGPTLEKLGEDLNLRLRLVGLVPVQPGNPINPYDDLGRKLIERGDRVLTRDSLEKLSRECALWAGRAIEEPDATRIGIRSFWRYAENLEDETDATLCLLRHFNGRFPRVPNTWNEIIAPAVIRFLDVNVKPSRSFHIRLQTHGSIAFIAGWALNPKSGVDIVPVQDSLAGRHIWRKAHVSPEIEKHYPKWDVSVIKLEPANTTDTVLAISATHNIEKDVLKYVRLNVKTAGSIVHFLLPSAGPSSVKDGTHAHLLAECLVATVRELCGGQGGVLHVFFAAPNGIMFLLGRLAHVLGKLVLYEHDLDAGGAAYYQSISVPISCGSSFGTRGKHKGDME